MLGRRASPGLAYRAGNFAAGLLALAASVSNVTWADDAVPMTFAANLPLQTVQPEIIGGSPVQDPAKWAATLIFRGRSGQPCTATAIGARAVLTAAHCIEDGLQGSVETAAGTLTLTCQYHPDYPANESADFALCDLPSGRRLPEVPYEKVDVDGGIVVLGADVHLLGYGCTQIAGLDEAFGDLYHGTAAVVEVPGADLYAVTDGGYVASSGGAAVCFGDSGGGAYVHTNLAQTKRRLVAVNAKGDIVSRSWLATTANGTFVEWARQWAADHGARICGLHADAGGCRGD